MNPMAVFNALTLRQKATSGAAFILTLVLMFFIAKQVTQPDYSLLYADLEPSTAGEVIARLDGLGVGYRVDGGAIYTESARRDSLRLELAREGLPRQDVVGYELFDEMNSFAMSSDMFDTAYWRAKEGELARSILVMPGISAARVHIGHKNTRGFRSRENSITASVTLQAQPGIDSRQAKAIQYLVALAVPDLQPQSVAIIDARGGLIAGPGLEDGAAMTDNDLGRAAALKADILGLLEARVGTGNARVNVYLDVETNRSKVTERRFDPDGRVLRTQTVTDSTNTNSGTTGTVTVASNLPDGAAGGGNSQSERAETTETTSYEISEILTEQETLPGKVNRISVAVLLDHNRIISDEGIVSYEPREASELEAVEALVRAAAGLDVERGDMIRVENMAFNRPESSEFVTPPGIASNFAKQHGAGLLKLLILCLFGLVALLFFVRPLLKAFSNPVTPALDGPFAPLTLPSGNDAEAGQFAAAALPAPDPRARLGEVVKENTDEAAALLAQWLKIEDQSGTTQP